MTVSLVRFRDGERFGLKRYGVMPYDGTNTFGTNLSISSIWYFFYTVYRTSELFFNQAI